MNTHVLPTTTGSQADLRAAVGEDILLALTLEAVQSLPFQPCVMAKERPNARMMHTLVTYGYASGLFCSQDVEKAALSDATMRYICAREFIQAGDVRNFRRGNRSSIEHCLAVVIAQGWLRTDKRPAFRNQQGEAQHAAIMAAGLRSACHRLKLAMLLDAEAED